MKEYVYIVLFFVLSVNCVAGKNVGYFWQVTDFHLDANYSTSGNPTRMCHAGTGGSFQLGSYGDYLCDSPWKLVTAAVEGMESIHSHPDFILWTGDSVPHINNTELDAAKVYTLIGNVTEALVEVFPNTTIYPVLGNHDPYPENQMPFNTDKTKYYKHVLNVSGWDNLLQPEQADQFKHGGYYSVDLNPKVRLIGLNTNLYNDQDRFTKDIDDPAGQFLFMRNELEAVRRHGQKALLFAHIAPGMFELVPDLMWFAESFNQKYLQMIMEFADVISGQMYGHEHTDSFRVLSDDHGKPLSSMFLSPAVTPWKSTLPGVGANNPSIRLFHYDRDNGCLLKYEQYYLNLTEANSMKAGDTLAWKMEYDTEKDFGLDSLRPEKMNSLANLLYQRKREFDFYIKYNSVLHDTDPVCNDTCFIQHMCAITVLHHDHYMSCLSHGKTTRKPDTTTHHHHTTPTYPMPRYMYYIIGVLAVVVFVLFFIIAFLCFNRRKRVVPPRYSKFGSLSVNS